jgi:hypothetical protein
MSTAPDGADGCAENRSGYPVEAEAEYSRKKGENESGKHKYRSGAQPDERQGKQQKFYPHTTAPSFGL